MQIIKGVNQEDVMNHWREVEGHPSEDFRTDIRDPLPNDVKWHLACIDASDVAKLYIISSPDWRNDGLCVPDFKLTTTIYNYQNSTDENDKYQDIREKEVLLKDNINAIDTKLFLVSEAISGPFTIIEGNRRAVALGSLGKLIGLEIFIGISSAMKSYNWASQANK